jgi:hypothetical protein
VAARDANSHPEVAIFRLTLTLTIVSLVTMALIDRALGGRAEFLNAWSAVERLLGRVPSGGTSLVAARLGAFGEAVVVILVNTGIGALLATLVRLGTRLLR